MTIPFKYTELILRQTRNAHPKGKMAVLRVPGYTGRIRLLNSYIAGNTAKSSAHVMHGPLPLVKGSDGRISKV